MIDHKDLKEAELQSGIIIQDLDNDIKDKLDGIADNFIQYIDDVVGRTGSMEELEDKIANMGSEFFRGASQNSLSNEILKRTLSHTDTKSNFNQNMVQYRKTLNDLQLEKNMTSKNVIQRAIAVIPGSKYARNKLHRFQEKFQSSRGFLEGLEKQFNEEILNLRSDIENMGQEKVNIFESIKKSKEYIYLIETLRKKAEEKQKVLTNAAQTNGNNQYQIQSDLIGQHIVGPTLKREMDIKGLLLNKHVNYQAISNLINTNREVIKQTERTMDLAMPTISTTMIVMAAAEQNKRALKLITSTGEITNKLIADLGTLMKENQKTLHKVQAGSQFDLNTLMKTANDIKQLQKEDEEFMKKNSDTIRKSIEQLDPALFLMDRELEDNKAQEITEGLLNAQKIEAGEIAVNKGSNKGSKRESISSIDNILDI